ncbi:MAG: hypothetical protein JWO67_4732 [Streptosporangiaceae bacterium]|nr:hypothetical protein [Streptosporangiaceae bacterium]
MANCALAALWGFSTVGGWGEAAFCGKKGAIPEGPCAAGLEDAVAVSTAPAALAVVIALSAWALPRIRRHDSRLEGVLTVSAFIWLAAEGVLFIGGMLSQP